MIRFIYTADVLLGHPFHGVTEGARGPLEALRRETLSRIVHVAQAAAVDFVVVSGNFFASSIIDDAIIEDVCARLAACEVPFYIVPGPRDPYAEVGSVYSGSTWKRACPEGVEVLGSPSPVSLQGGAAELLPAPAAPAWRGDPTLYFGRSARAGVIRIGATWAGDTLDLAAPHIEALDYLAAGGHEGVPTPEPTACGQEGAGIVRLVEIGDAGAPARVQAQEVAQVRWLTKDVQLKGEESIEELARWFGRLERRDRTVVELKIGGSLPMSLMKGLESTLSAASSGLLMLQRRGSLVARPTADELDAVATDGYVRMAIDRLSAQSEGSGEEAAVAAMALGLLFRVARGGG